MSRQPKSDAPRKRSNPDKVFADNKFKTIVAKTDKQKKYMEAMNNFTIVFGIGPAGTGKSMCSMGWSLEQLYSNQTNRIIITRPAVEAGASLGFLPGTQEEKFAPYIQPLKEIANKCFGSSYTDMLIKEEKISAIPVPYCRGRTWDDSIIIVDEAQNLTLPELKMLLTRIGRGSKMIVSGDVTQSDIHNSGFVEALDIVSYIPQVKVIEFNIADVVRSGIVSEIIQAFYQRGK